MGEILIARLGELAILNEATKGTKSATILLDGTNSKLRVYDLEVIPDISKFERATMSKTLSRYPHLVGRALMRMTFRVELRKTAVTGTEDAWGNLLRAAGMAFADGVYSPTTLQSAHRTLTMYAMLGSDGAAAIRYGMRGCMGNIVLSGRVGEPLMMACEFYGASDTDDVDDTPSGTFAMKPTDDVLNTITHEAGKPAIFQGVGFTYNAQTRRLPGFELDFGVEISPRDDIGSDQGCFHYVVTNRQPMVKIDPDMGLVAEDDYLTDDLVGTETALAWSLAQPAAGGVNARTIAFSAPKAQISAVTFGNRNGYRTAGLTMPLNRAAEPGDDEFSITITGA